MRVLARLVMVVVLLALVDILLYLAISSSAEEPITVGSETIMQAPLEPVQFVIDDGVPDVHDEFRDYQIDKASKDRYEEIRYTTAKDNGEKLKVICY